MIAFNLRRRPFQFLGCRDALVFQSGDTTRIYRFGNQRNGNAEVLRRNDGPFAGPLLSSGIQDLIHQRLSILVFERQNL